MPSTLTGLIRALTWRDYPRPRAGNAPGAGQAGTAAFTHTSFLESGISFPQIAGSQFALRDNVSVRASFDSGESFVMAWLFKRPQQEQDDMLNHEQGHYNITALLSRDFFIDVMLLKGQTFPTAQAGRNAVQQIKKQSVNKLKTVHDLYDAEVHPEQRSGQSRGPKQLFWDGFFQTAFTIDRPEGTIAPNGGLHKVRLIDVLKQLGQKQI